jgi:hypothetical protein
MDVQPAPIDRARWYSGGATPDEILRVSNQLKVAALVEAVRRLGLRELVAGWNGEDREKPYTPHPSGLGVTLKTTCGVVYAIDAALAAIEARK